MTSAVDGFTRFEELLRWNLDPVANGKGRPIHEYGLRVEKTPEDVLVVMVNAAGFNAEAMVFGVNGGGLTTSAELEQAIEQARTAREAATKLADEEAARVRAEEASVRRSEIEADQAKQVQAQAAATAQAAADEQARIDAAVKIAVEAALTAAGVKPVVITTPST